MSFSEWIISRTCGQTMVQLFYTTYISVDPAYYKIFHDKDGQGGIISFLLECHMKWHMVDRSVQRKQHLRC